MKKAELAQVIIQALCNLDEKPAADSARVQNLARTHTKVRLEELHCEAVAILEASA